MFEGGSRREYARGGKQWPGVGSEMQQSASDERDVESALAVSCGTLPGLADGRSGSNPEWNWELAMAPARLATG